MCTHAHIHTFTCTEKKKKTLNFSPLEMNTVCKSLESCHAVFSQIIYQETHNVDVEMSTGDKKGRKWKETTHTLPTVQCAAVKFTNSRKTKYYQKQVRDG